MISVWENIYIDVRVYVFRETDEKVTTSEMNLASDEEAILSKSDKDIDEKDIVSEVSEASNEEIFIMELSDDNDSIENLSLKGKKSEGIIITELSDDNDNIKKSFP